MKKIITLLTIAATILTLIGVFGLSGCEISGDQPCAVNTTIGVDDHVIDLTEHNITLHIEGDEVIQPCLTGPIYTATAPGWTFIGSLQGVEWVVSGDIAIDGDAHYNPLTIIGTKDNGYGTIELVTLGTEECPGGEVLASTSVIVSFAKNIDIISDVCMDPVTMTGSGKLQLVYAPWLPTVSPAFIDDCVWSVASGSADLEPQPDKVTCLVKNATGDFTVHCEVTHLKCSSEGPISFDIKVPACGVTP